jgi:hypothetical protein
MIHYRTLFTDAPTRWRLGLAAGPPQRVAASRNGSEAIHYRTLFTDAPTRWRLGLAAGPPQRVAASGNGNEAIHYWILLRMRQLVGVLGWQPDHRNSLRHPETATKRFTTGHFYGRANSLASWADSRATATSCGIQKRQNCEREIANENKFSIWVRH